jgi:hypothetical protein
MKTKLVIIILAVTIIVAALIVLFIVHPFRINESLESNRAELTAPEKPAVDRYEKPIIYLYPVEPTEITVHLQYAGILDFTYPAYQDGWSVTAYPDGTLVNHRDGKEYSYLFWEGHGEANHDLSRGFVIKGEDTAEFLQEKLSYIGLLPEEYNEFIVYWLPLMQNNPYNLISFQDEAYTDTAELIITPAPDSVLRVFMAFMPLDVPVEIEEQLLSPFTRTGFTVIEWGGCKLQ